MKLTEALELVRRAPEGGTPFEVLLACGFTPLHIQTFLAAHLQAALPDRRVGVTSGLYGDTAGTLEAFQRGSVHAVALALEWPDLDPRLGFRSLGGWGPQNLGDIVSSARGALERLSRAVATIAGAAEVAVCLPTLALPPVFHTPGWRTADAEVALRHSLTEFAARVLEHRTVGIVNADTLSEISPFAARFDLKSDLTTGIPYTIRHTDMVSSQLARLLGRPAPKKGLITDLDDTLWHGIVGEVGPAHVSWDLASHHQEHGLYQNTLASLAAEGVLVAVASKNDRPVVEAVFERPDLLLRHEQVFPLEVHWHAKSSSITNVLRTWNIAADSVVFVDDSPMELAEVAATHPDITCLQFPKGDPNAVLVLLRRLRDLFGKPTILAEDALRLQSIRQAEQFRTAAEDTPEAFLASAESAVAFDFENGADNPRVLELVNKTNQFNLNGVRYTPADWRLHLAVDGAFVASIDYQDRFGPLGTIAVLQGRHRGTTLHIDAWVMSCRAFSRRIEHQCLNTLFSRFGVDEIVLDFRATPKNGPLQNFLEEIAGTLQSFPLTVSRGLFDGRCRPLYHAVHTTPTGRISSQCTTQ